MTNYELTQEEKNAIDNFPKERVTRPSFCDQRSQTHSEHMIEDIFMRGIDAIATAHLFQRALQRLREKSEKIDAFTQRFNIHLPSGKNLEYCISEGWNMAVNDPFHFPLKKIEQDGVYIPRGAYYERRYTTSEGTILDNGGIARQVCPFSSADHMIELEAHCGRESEERKNALFLHFAEKQHTLPEKDIPPRLRNWTWSPDVFENEEFLLRGARYGRDLWRIHFNKKNNFWRREDISEEEKLMRKLLSYYDQITKV